MFCLYEDNRTEYRYDLDTLTLYKYYMSLEYDDLNIILSTLLCYEMYNNDSDTIQWSFILYFDECKKWLMFKKMCNLDILKILEDNNCIIYGCKNTQINMNSTNHNSIIDSIDPSRLNAFSLLNILLDKEKVNCLDTKIATKISSHHN